MHCGLLWLSGIWGLVIEMPEGASQILLDQCFSTGYDFLGPMRYL